MIFVQSCPHDKYQLWQLELHLWNYIEKGYTDEYHNLIYYRFEEELSKDVEVLKESFKDYPFLKFYTFRGTKKLHNLTERIGYVPLNRLYCLINHWKNNPYLVREVIYYNDADTLWIKKLDFTKFLNDKICYLSWTGSKDRTYNYIAHTHFKSKEANLIRNKELDPLAKLATLTNIKKEIIVDNFHCTGGAQYLLKNITAEFWQSVLDDCVNIKAYLRIYNQASFKGETEQERENNGLQSFCADMWALLWNLWKRKYITECPKELDFAWATDMKSELKDLYIYHNAGVTADIIIDNKVKRHVFHKGRYSNSYMTPYDNMELLVCADPYYASYFYSNALMNNLTKTIYKPQTQ